MSQFDFNAPNHFPKLENLNCISMLADESLEVHTQTGPPRCTTASFRCPKGSKMYDWLLTITGPLESGESYLFVEGLEYGTD